MSTTPEDTDMNTKNAEQTPAVTAGHSGRRRCSSVYMSEAERRQLPPDYRYTSAHLPAPETNHGGDK
jgi:hypothetical protein